MSQEDITIWRNILAITITWGVLFPVFVMEIQYEQLYLKHLGASPFYIGITYAAGIVALSISRLLGGYLADNIGRKKLIYVFTYIVGILFFIPYLIVDWVIVAFTLVIINIFFLFQPAVSALIADSSEARLRGKLYALMNILSLLVTIPAPMIANYLVGLYGLVNGMRLIYLITAIIFLLSGFLRQAMLVETFRMSENKIEFADMLKGYKCTIKFSFNYLKWPLFARIILFSTGFAILNFTGIYVSDILGLGKMYWGEVFFYSNIITVVIVLSLGFLSDKIGRKIPILSSMIFFIPTVALLYLVNPVLENIFIYLVIGVSGILVARGTIFSILFALEADLMPKKIRGKATAILSLIGSLVSAAFQIFFGYVFEINPRMIYLIAIILTIIGLIYLTLTKPRYYNE